MHMLSEYHYDDYLFVKTMLFNPNFARFYLLCVQSTYFCCSLWCSELKRGEALNHCFLPSNYHILWAHVWPKICCGGQTHKGALDVWQWRGKLGFVPNGKKANCGKWSTNLIASDIKWHHSLCKWLKWGHTQKHQLHLLSNMWIETIYQLYWG